MLATTGTARPQLLGLGLLGCSGTTVVSVVSWLPLPSQPPAFNSAGFLRAIVPWNELGDLVLRDLLVGGLHRQALGDLVRRVREPDAVRRTAATSPTPEGRSPVAAPTTWAACTTRSSSASTAGHPPAHRGIVDRGPARGSSTTATGLIPASGGRPSNLDQGSSPAAGAGDLLPPPVHPAPSSARSWTCRWTRSNDGTTAGRSRTSGPSRPGPPGRGGTTGRGQGRLSTSTTAPRCRAFYDIFGTDQEFEADGPGAWRPGSRTSCRPDRSRDLPSNAGRLAGR